MKNRLISILTLMLILVQASSCGESGETPAGQTEQPTGAEPVETQEPEETGRAAVKDTLPDNLDFGGETLTLIIRPEFALYDATGEMSGDIVYDAVYERNAAVEDRLGVKLDYIQMPDNDFDRMARQVTNSIKSGTDEYDIVMQRGIQTFAQSVEGYYRDLSDAPYLDFEKPWWWMNIIRDSSIHSSKTFFLTGDISISTFLLSTVCYFNKELLSQYDHTPDEIYDAVTDGSWTYERFENICRDVSSDLNGNGKADAEDRYGFAYLNYGVQWLDNSAGIKFTKRGTDGYPELALNQEKTVQLTETLNRLLYEDNLAYLEPSGDYHELVRLFSAENTAFLLGRFMHVDNLRDMKAEYGYVPYPKLDETVGYLSGTGCSGNFLSVPVTSESWECACAALEAMASENYHNVFPVFYESAMKIKYVGDNRDAQMIDLIHDCIYVDFTLTAALDNVIDGLLKTNDSNFVSAYEKKASSLEKSLQTLIDKYNEIQ